MPRLSKLSPNQVDAASRQVFDQFMRERGNVPNMFRTVAHRPEIMRTMNQHFFTVMNTGTVSRKLKEMISVRVSYLNTCEYWLNSHTALARRFGATEAEMAALETGDFDVFAPPDRVALQFSEQLTHDSHAISDEMFAELRRHFDEGEIVEIAAVAGLFNYFNRFNNALQMEPTK